MRIASEEVSPQLMIVSGLALASLCMAYAAVLIAGLLTLPSSTHPIQNPWFTIMEVLILLIAPTMVVFTASLHSLVPTARKAMALLGVVFMCLCAVLTCLVHFAILTLSHHPDIATAPWAVFIFSFNWPSVAYAIDILAWDFFFALSALASALAIDDQRARVLFIVSSVLAFVGLAGVPLANMEIRNIGIVGYVVIYPIAAILLAARFKGMR